MRAQKSEDPNRKDGLLRPVYEGNISRAGKYVTEALCHAPTVRLCTMHTANSIIPYHVGNRLPDAPLRNKSRSIVVELYAEHCS
jgi:hypothetical protein